MACQKDHPTTPRYVRVRGDGRVVCRVCEAERSRRYRDRQKENA